MIANGDSRGQESCKSRISEPYYYSDAKRKNENGELKRIPRYRLKEIVSDITVYPVEVTLHYNPLYERDVLYERLGYSRKKREMWIPSTGGATLVCDDEAEFLKLLRNSRTAESMVLRKAVHRGRTFVEAMQGKERGRQIKMGKNK